VNTLNAAAGVGCLAGVSVLALVFGPGALTAGPGPTVFAGGLSLAGGLFLLAATEFETRVGPLALDLHDCSGLGDIAVGTAILGGLASIPGGVTGVVYVTLVVLGGAAAAGFGVVGLAEKHGYL